MTDHKIGSREEWLAAREDDNAIIIKFEPANVRDNFEYAFKMFSKALDAVLPNKEADPYISDFNYLSKKRYLIRKVSDIIEHF